MPLSRIRADSGRVNDTPAKFGQPLNGSSTTVNRANCDLQTGRERTARALSMPQTFRVLNRLLGLAAVQMLASTALAQSPDSEASAAPVIGAAALPRDLSPWGMFMSADMVVKAVIIGLAFASVMTWTIWLAKTIEIMVAK